MSEELPIVGKTYYCYDDGKITYNRQYKVKITDITPYKKASDEDKKLFGICAKNHSFLFAKTTDFIIHGIINEAANDEANNCIFARTINGDFFGMGHWNNGLLDISNELTENLINNDEQIISEEI